MTVRISLESLDRTSGDPTRNDAGTLDHGTTDPASIDPTPLRLLVELPSPARVFFGNLHDLVFPPRLSRLELRSAPAPFWPDVFVKRGLPWLGFLRSGACHVAAFALLFGIARLLALQPQPAPQPLVFDHSQVIYYSTADYLPPLDTRVATTKQVSGHSPSADPLKKADPEFSRQPIISLPHESDNRLQTIVAPPDVKLKREVALPNIVAWSDAAQRPRLAIPAAPLTPAAELSRIASPPLAASVVAPPPQVRVSAAAGRVTPQSAVIAPPPSIERESNQLANRSIGDLDIAHSPVIAPAPQLLLSEQHRIMGGRSTSNGSLQIVPPPPSLAASESSGASGRLIALNLHPTVGAPSDSPQGNRRGTFAATPEGHPGASGAISSSGAGGADGKVSRSVPSGLYVGAPPTAKTQSVAGDPASESAANHASSVSKPALTASARPPHANTTSALHTESAAKLSEVERGVFAGRKFYSLMINLPNLNSAGGSWVVRFGELNADPNSSGSNLSTELTAPVATLYVDPGYPMQLMRENIAGTVILYAIIHADGTVSDVRVLRGVDPRLDQRASDALAQWHFQPATKSDGPIDVEATFQIPFRPSKLNGF